MEFTVLRTDACFDRYRFLVGDSFFAGRGVVYVFPEGHGVDLSGFDDEFLPVQTQ